FRYSPERGRGGLLRQSVKRKKAGFRDLPIRQLGSLLLKALDEVNGHMVAAADVPAEMDGHQLRGAVEPDRRLLQQFPLQGFQRCLADLDAASRQLPAGNVGVADEEHGILSRVVDKGANPEGHRPLEAKVEMIEPCTQSGPS